MNITGTIYTIDKFFGTNAFLTDSNLSRINNDKIIQQNKVILQNNINQYSTLDNIKIIVGTSIELNNYINTNTKIGIVFIDSNGMIDIDFEVFYNNINDNGIIVLDDYDNKPNNISQDLIKMTDIELNTYIEERKYPNGKRGKNETLKTHCLGKHARIYKIVQFLVKHNYVKIVNHINMSVIVRKLNKYLDIFY